MTDILTLTALSIAVAGFVVGVVVGLTGMGGGALMTPALIFLGVGGGEAATVPSRTDRRARGARGLPSAVRLAHRAAARLHACAVP